MYLGQMGLCSRPAALSDRPFLWRVEAATKHLPALVWLICDFLRIDSKSWFLFVHLSKTHIMICPSWFKPVLLQSWAIGWNQSSLKTKLQKIKSFQSSYPSLHSFPVHLLAVRKQKFCTCVPSPIGCRSLGIRPSNLSRLSSAALDS